ncbi:RagB/SusD family nutrient uptake outer membrane protein [Flavobacterium johnsoniae]|uniref:RagB/SusD family nutrient uptake outer membrane protein n=1 Tax=Flavobacterium johnsoniae TaxID=986 RepID=UPI0033946949
MRTLYRTEKNISSLIFKRAFFFGTLLMLLSCDSFVEVDLPKSQLTSTAVFRDYASANAAMADVYSKMRDVGMLTGGLYGLSVQLGNYTDELTFYGSPTSPTASFFANTILPSNSTISLLWNNTYNQIYETNAILNGVEGTYLNIQQRTQLGGEAYFVRGLLHFYLLQLYGPIPYIKSTDYKQNSETSRLPVEKVYQYIIEDLKKAEQMLSQQYSSTERTRPNSLTAKALLAKIYLYQGAWDEADRMSSSIIENSLYKIEVNLNKVFLKNSTETIWQFMPASASKNTDDAVNYIFVSGPPPLMSLSESLVNSFSAEDQRKSMWIASLTSQSGKWYYANKYKESKPTTPSREYTIIMRLSEQYLIRAEARVYLQNLTGAVDDLNKIRNRAGIRNVTEGTAEEILEYILSERRKELFTENGHRFFDLKRTGKLDTELGNKPGWKSSYELLPIPETEITLNPNLKPQNTDY